MENHSLSFCTVGDVNELIEFIATQWKADHIFVKSRTLFDFQHKIDDENYSFVLARQDGRIVACLGFTAMEQYLGPGQRKQAAGKHPFYGKGLWLCIWKSREDVATGMGFYLLRFLEETLQPEWMCATGYSPYAERVYKMLRWERTLMKHFFRLNTNISPENLTLIKAEQPAVSATRPAGLSCVLKQAGWDELHELNTGAATPKKTPDYLIGRYANHPVFQYELLALEYESRPIFYLVARMVEVPEGKCLRIIDAYGDISQSLFIDDADIYFTFYPGIQYVDFLCEGLNPELISGLGLREKTDNEIVPEYFSPFSPENITIKAAVNKPIEGFYYCKGDADQDRPN